MSRASAKPKDAPVRALRSLREAAKFLTGQGLKCGKSTLADAVQAGRIVRTPDGGFDPAGLLRWAAASVEPGAEPDTLQREKLVEIVRGLRAKADRLETQAARERGELLPRRAVERAFVYRATQLAADAETWTHVASHELCDRFDLGTERLWELREFLHDAVRRWLATYAEEEEFSLPPGLVEQALEHLHARGLDLAARLLREEVPLAD